MKTVIACALVAFALGCDKKNETDDEGGDPQTFTLTLEAGTNGAVTADRPGPTYSLDTLVTLTAVPDTDFRVDVWAGTDNDGLVGNTNTVTMGEDRSVSVTFAAITADVFTLTLDPGAGGTLVADPAGPTYVDNTTVTLTAAPEVDFVLQSWSGTDNDAATGLTNTVTMHADTTVGVTFVSNAGSFTLTIITAPTYVGASTWGHVHADPPDADYNVTNSSSPEAVDVVYPADTVVTLSAHQTTASWAFTHWTMPGGASNTNCQVTVTMDADKEITAHFPVGNGTGCP